VREIKTQIFTFEELSSEAKEQAKTSMGLLDDYHWGDEAFLSLQSFFERLNVKITDWWIDWLDPFNASVNYEVSEISNLDVNFDTQTCSLTGVYSDIPLIETYNETKDIDKTISKFFKWCCKDFERQMDDNYAKGYATANEYEFYSNGKIYR